jgi:hypothetical protein
MRRVKGILGWVSGALMVTSAGAHSLAGWKVLRAELERANAPADLILALSLGWQFAGTAMFVFGLIVFGLVWLRMRGRAVSLWPAMLIGVAYIGFGACALVLSNFDKFFLVFLVPGILLTTAAALRD